MNVKEDGCMGIRILSPVTGQAVKLDDVPDPVFSGKILGDGAAVIPSEGKIVSPVDGEVVSVAETLHAYGLRTAEGLELLIHVGLDTVKLKGSCFQVHVKEGEQVKAGDLLAEVDLEALKAEGLNPVTPVLVCDGLQNRTLNTAEGEMKAGESELLLVLDECCAAGMPEAAGEAAAEAADEKKGGDSVSAPKKEKKKFPINFDFLQKLGKVLMTVIAVMPAAGLMISIGKLVQMAGVDVNVIVTIGSTMENIGWAIINNLHILFAAAIGGSWAKERAGGAFAAVIAFILINTITGAIFGVT